MFQYRALGLAFIQSVVTVRHSVGAGRALEETRPMPLFWLVLLGGSFFVFASGRFVPAQAILSLAVPPRRRGAFLSLSSCARDIMAGLTTAVGGWLVVKTPTGEIVGYDRLGWIAVISGVFSVWLASRVRTVEHSILMVAVGVPAAEVAEVAD